MTWSLADDAMSGARLAEAGSRRLVSLADRGTWYGQELQFQATLERNLGAHVEHRGRVTKHMTAAYVPGMPRVLQYRHLGVDVPSLRRPVPVLVEFHEFPTYRTFGRHPGDYPRVFADPGADSPHRMPEDDALCLYYPLDGPERCWSAADGLVALFNTVANHVFFEVHWRATGQWLGEEAPHGTPADRTRPRRRRR